MPSSDRTDPLAQVFQFSEMDLQSNQQGKIAEGQKKIVASSRNARMISMIAYAVMLGVALLICLGVGISVLINRGDNAIRLAMMFAMAVAMLAGDSSISHWHLVINFLLSQSPPFMLAPS